ncbi:MAG: type II secretion system protein GspE [Candidatus Eisenbacteria bacterium]|nr:type II secretion system protein GspE [Candidatus Eisenbacteria bacterium]
MDMHGVANTPTDKDLDVSETGPAETASLDLQNLDIDAHVVRLVPREMARRFCVAAVGREGDTLLLAMADPLDVIACDTVSANTGYEVKPAEANREEILSIIDTHYGESLDIEKSIQNIVGVEVEGGTETDADGEQLSIEPNDAPVIRLVNLILLQAIEEGASDIHIEPREKELAVRLRVDGVLREILPPPKRMQWAVTSRIKIMSRLNIAERRLPQDGSCRVRVLHRVVDIRVSTIPTIYGEKVVMRLLDKANLKTELEDLGFDPESLSTISDAIRQPHGMILLTGPTGSGKTTTLYSALTKINSPDKNIMTVEDPVEYELAGINQVRARPEIKLDFAAALRSFLRQDPDVILVGEIRDLETASIAIKAAQTGHLVFSTLHTNDATSAIDRLMNMGVEPYLICSSLNLVIAQRLVRRICSNCKEPYEPDPVLVEHFSRVLPEAQDVTFYHGAGCVECSKTGYKGRVALYELFPITRQIKDSVLQGTVGSAMRDRALEGGMVPLVAHGMNKVREGVTTLDEVLSVASGAA